jgi:hypothetical protein
MRKAVLLPWAALFLAGCISVSTGETTTTRSSPATTTLGQQLQDLRSEYDRGLISQQEYNERRERLLGN